MHALNSHTMSQWMRLKVFTKMRYVEEHKEVCHLEIIQCNYHVVASYIGCEVKMACKDVNTHNKQEILKISIQLSLSINELSTLKLTSNMTWRRLKMIDLTQLAHNYITKHTIKTLTIKLFGRAAVSVEWRQSLEACYSAIVQ